MHQNTKDMNWLSDVLERLLTKIGGWESEFAAGLCDHGARDADATRLGKRFKSCGNVRLRQRVRRGISIGRYVIRRGNPRPDPDCQVANNEQRRRGLQPRTGGQELTAERAGNSLSRISHGLQSMPDRSHKNAEA